MQKVQLGLLGNNLGRSRAKNLHELLGEIYGLNVHYRPIDLLNENPSGSIAAALEQCRQEGFRGVNVTHPYKQQAFQLVQPMADFPSALNAVNTVLFEKEGMVANNTDYSGCYRAFITKLGSDFKPGRVLMLGAGGVGVAIAHAMNALGADELIVHDINAEMTKGLLAQFSSGSMQVRSAGQDLLSEMEAADGLINATPIGMFQYPGNPFYESGIHSQRWAFDAVYTPENTEFLHSCRMKKIPTLSGFYLFWYQGLDAFKHFTGITPGDAEIESLFLKCFPLE
ncbi:shikimate dehydrogenase family protein [Desulfogranum japonicum]|uniref:shikimate dehydrogenase family protein n=1 Tax=Desulfogranum japonicum TaxID=231447 RepID=UPI00041FADC3|nr:hypothetical protein [Desulfogranum japonicum]